MYGVNGMFKYIMRNILMIIPTVLGVVFIVFTINQFTPGDPVILMLGADYTQEQYDETAAELGVDQRFLHSSSTILKISSPNLILVLLTAPSVRSWTRSRAGFPFH